MPIRRPICDMHLIAALLLWSAVGIIALVLAGRALAGAFDETVSAVIPLLATGITLCGSLAAWTLFHKQQRHGDAGQRLLDGLWSLLPGGVAGFAAAVNAGSVTLAGITCLMICGLTYVVAREGMRTGADLRTSGLPSEAIDDPEEALPSGPHGRDLTVLHSDAPHPELPPEHDESVSQQITRRSLPDGSEVIEAVLLVGFSPGQREVDAHLPIHPVLRTRPQVEAEPLDDADISIRLAAVYSYGVRVSVKRSGPVSHAMSTSVGVLITAPASSQSAA